MFKFESYHVNCMLSFIFFLQVCNNIHVICLYNNIIFYYHVLYLLLFYVNICQVLTFLGSAGLIISVALLAYVREEFTHGSVESTFYSATWDKLSNIDEGYAIPRVKNF